MKKMLLIALVIGFQNSHATNEGYYWGSPSCFYRSPLGRIGPHSQNYACTCNGNQGTCQHTTNPNSGQLANKLGLWCLGAGGAALGNC